MRACVEQHVVGSGGLSVIKSRSAKKNKFCEARAQPNRCIICLSSPGSRWFAGNRPISCWPTSRTQVRYWVCADSAVAVSFKPLDGTKPGEKVSGKLTVSAPEGFTQLYYLQGES